MPKKGMKKQEENRRGGRKNLLKGWFPPLQLYVVVELYIKEQIYILLVHINERPLKKMTEIDYQNECIRAELFDLPIPSREEFFSRQRETGREENAREEEEKEEEETEQITTTEQEESAGIRKEGFQRLGRGFDELNSILSNTQKRLNRFKTIHGSLVNLLKLKIGSKNEETANATSLDSGSGNFQDSEENKSESASSCSVINKGGDSQLDKLDSLINKAERAEISISKQNKQMRKFLN